jgi:hypothetical protein
MELEYPFKIILYLVVIMVLIGILYTMKNKIVNICFFPPCEKENECDVSPSRTNEDINEATINKYSYLCFDKSKNCKQDVLCYIISSDVSAKPSSLKPECLNNDLCEITCNKDVNMVYINYNWIKSKVEIGC